MKKLIICISALSVIAVKAQVNVTNKDSLKLPKNEIGFNLLPVVSFLGGANLTESSGYSLNYRHYLDAKNAIRVSASVFPFQSNNPVAPSDGLSFYQLSDTNLIYKSVQNKQKAKFQLNIGYERIFSRRKVIQSFGADAFLNYQHLESREVYYWSGKSTPLTESLDHPTVNKSVVDTMGTNRVIDNIGVGIHAFYNLRIPIAKHWLISTTIGPGFSVNNSKNKYSVKNTGSVYQMRFSNFDFNAIVFSDLSICYRF